MLKNRLSAFYRPAIAALVLTLVLTAFSGFFQNIPVAHAAAFTPGNIVVVRVGDGTVITSGAASPVFLDEYTSAGTLVQSIALPTTASGNNKRLTMSNSATSEGALALSSDGQYLTVVGYDAAVGTTGIGSTASITVNRTIGRIDYNGTIDTSTALNDLSTGNNVRSAVTSNGVDLWATGGAGGIRYTTLGTAGTSTQLATTLTNLRVLNIFGGQLYVTTSSGSAVRLGTVGTGLPTTSGQTITNLPGFPTSTGSPYAFFFADLNSGVAGVDTVYVADDTANTGGVQKYSLVSGSWVSNGTFTGANSLRGLAGKVSGNTVTLYASNTISQVVAITDTAGYNSATSAVTSTLATSTANTVFRGVAFVPQVAVTAPSITQNPQSVTINNNTSTILTVTATGTAPLSYQWYQGTSGNTSTPVGTNSNSFTTPNLTSTTSYWVRVSNAQGSADSTTAVVTVNPPNNTPPQISAIPALSGVINDPTNPSISFTVSDTETAAGALTVTVSSSNPAVAPNANITVTNLGGNNRSIAVNPTGVGYSSITVTVTDDGNLTASTVLNYAASAASNTPTTTRYHTGTSDASTAIVVDANYMLVGDDENQVLRLYNRQNSGLPVNGFDYTTSLNLTDISGGVPREVDIEASARSGNRIYWMGSLSNSSSGNNRPNRNRIFATDISGTGATATLSFVGYYNGLRGDLIAWDQNNGHGKGANYYGLAASAATGSIPEATDGSGFNVEGFEIAPNGTDGLISFRAPISPANNRTKALIVPITNLAGLVNGTPATGPAQFGAPIELDLGGRGIREIRRNGSGQYLISAGPADVATGIAPKDFRLYIWSGNPNEAPLMTTADLTSLNTGGSFESILDVPNNLTPSTQIQLLSDNGDTIYYNDGVIAKDLTQPRFKKFRSDIVTLGSIVPLTPTVTLTSAPNPAKVGQSVAFTATVSGASAVLTGTVVFTDTTSNQTLGTVNLVNGQAVLSNITFNTAGSYTIVAGYAGNDFYLPGTSANYTQNVEKYSSTTSLTSTPNPAKVGQSVTFTATVSGAGATPTGTVIFTDTTSNLNIGSANLVNGQAVLSNITFNTAGSYNIVAGYSGSTVYSNSVSSGYTQNVEKYSSTTTLTSTPNPAKVSQSVIFTATVSGAGASPTGTVTFTNTTSNQTLGTANLVNGQAVLNNATFNTAGSYNIVASYGGSTVYTNSVSSGYTQNVEKYSSSITLTSTPNPAKVGQSVIFTATVSGAGATPTGTVTFTNTTSNQTLGTANLVNGQAVLSNATFNTAGSYNIVANYGGSIVYSNSVSSGYTQNVEKYSSTITLTSNPNPSNIGQSVVFTATVSGAGATPGGSVVFTNTTTNTGLGSATLDNSGVATITVSNLPVGSNNVQAFYGGNSSYLTSTTNVIQVVGLQGSSLSLASTPNPSTFGQVVTFTATLNPISATGTITFTENGQTLAVRSVVNGSAVFTTSTLTVGSHPVVATYGGDATYGGSLNQVTQVVVAQCNPYTVTATTDDGKGTLCGTLSYALAQQAGTITFALTQGSTITFTGSLTVTVKAGVVIDGGVCGSVPQISLNGANVAGAGLVLGGNNTLRNLNIYGFSGPQLSINSGGNKLQCVRFSRN